MPELPEVETIRRGLEREVVGKRVKTVQVTGTRTIRRQTKKVFISKLEGAKINGVERRGKYLLLKLDTGLEKPAYNYIIHTSPFDTQALPHYHWHIEVIPRLTRVAGFEWGTGFYINPVPPEQAATFLRETKVDLTAVRPV